MVDTDAVWSTENQVENILRSHNLSNAKGAVIISWLLKYLENRLGQLKIRVIKNNRYFLKNVCFEKHN